MEKLKLRKKSSLSTKKSQSIRNKVYLSKYRPKLKLLNTKYNIYKDLDKSTFIKNRKNSIVK